MKPDSKPGLKAFITTNMAPSEKAVCMRTHIIHPSTPASAWHLDIRFLHSLALADSRFDRHIRPMIMLVRIVGKERFVVDVRDLNVRIASVIGWNADIPPLGRG